MRRIAFLFILVVTAALIPGKRVKAQAPVVDRSVVVVKAEQAGVRSVKVIKSALPGARGHSTGRNVGMAVGWLVLVSVVGFALLAFGADKVQVVVNTVQAGVGRSLFTGLLGHLAIVPGAVAVVALLAATLIGILVIPLGLLAYIVAVAGIGMVGFIAVAIMTGAALTGGKGRDSTPHGAMLRAFLQIV